MKWNEEEWTGSPFLFIPFHVLNYASNSSLQLILSKQVLSGKNTIPQTLWEQTVAFGSLKKQF